jgi:hypothetical protein
MIVRGEITERATVVVWWVANIVSLPIRQLAFTSTFQINYIHLRYLRVDFRTQVMPASNPVHCHGSWIPSRVQWQL